MALPIQVKTYLAYWCQLGRGLRMPPSDKLVKPQTVLSQGGYSQEFELLWAQLNQPSIAAQCYLDGTTQTIAQLLDSNWEIQDCSRCGLPIPMKAYGLPDLTCPCTAMEMLPNLDTVPAPRQPIDSQKALQDLCERLHQTGVQAG